MPTSRRVFLGGRITKQIWFPCVLFSLLAVLTALAGALLTPLLPDIDAAKIGANAVDSILTILASSMLTVATFSLTTMVSAIIAASSATTPRATTLLVEDRTTQTALAVFVGAFLYSLVGIIALSTGVYGDDGRVILFLVTVVVILVVVATLLRWINRLTRFGRVGETIDRVEAVTAEALARHARRPCLGGRPSAGAPDGGRRVFAPRVGYVQHVDAASLQRLADRGGREVHVTAAPGAFVDPTRPLGRLSGTASEDDEEAFRSAFTVADARDFGQDPRFGLIVLAEIASKALSPGINDPGTAIRVIGALARVLHDHAPTALAEEGGVRYPRVRVPPLDPDALFDDAFRPIARDGAGLVEVGVRLQKALASLAAVGDDAFRRAALRASCEAVERASRALTIPADVAHVKEAAPRHAPAERRPAGGPADG